MYPNEKNFGNLVFTEEQLKEQLNKIFGDPLFSLSEILKRFLAFIVHETFAGRSNQLKEYTIGVNVLNKPVDFNPQQNGIIRIHAGRLRRALHQYYHSNGINDPIIISLPKGSYVPSFNEPFSFEISEDNDETFRENVRHTPISLAVLPFRHYETKLSRISFIEGLSEHLSNELSRFQDISVIAYHAMHRQTPEKNSDAKEVAPEPGARYIISGNILFQSDDLRIHVELIDSENSEKIWANMYERKFNAKNMFAIQDDIVKQVVDVLGDYCGLIVRHMAKASKLQKTNDMEVYSAILWYYHFHSEFTAEAFHRALKAMETAVRREPDYAMAWACLSELYLNAYLFDHTMRGNVYERSLKCALKATQLDPQCQNAYVALARSYNYLNDKKNCIAAIEHCISLNPGAVTIAGMEGFLFICCGENEKGFKLMERSIQLNRFYPPWFNAGFAFYYMLKKDYECAYYWAKKMNLPGLAWDYLLRASILGHLNRIPEARTVIHDLLKQFPDFHRRIKDYINLLILNEELSTMLTEGLQLSGLQELRVA
jgi:TolB-like protein/Tfp pilus assembly protein PilF